MIEEVRDLVNSGLIDEIDAEWLHKNGESEKWEVMSLENSHVYYTGTKNECVKYINEKKDSILQAEEIYHYLV